MERLDRTRPWMAGSVEPRAAGPGVRFGRGDGDVEGRTKANADGFYLLGGSKFRIKAGDHMPPGAKFVATADNPKPEKPAARAKPKPENRAVVVEENRE